MAEEHAKPKLEQDLQRKVAGVPVWGIGVILALVFIGVLWYRNKVNAVLDNTSGTTATDSGSDIDPATGLPYASESTGYDDPSSVLSGLDPSSPSYPVGLTAQGTPAPTTNIQWSRLVADELLAKGDDPSLVSNALVDYLAGNPLNASEQGVVNAALQLFGAPPEGLLPVTTPQSPAPVTSNPAPVTPAPPTTPTSPKPVTTPVTPTKPVATTPKYTTVVAFTTKNPKWNSTLSGIAAHYGISLSKLLSLNPQYKANPNLIHVGDKVRYA